MPFRKAQVVWEGGLRGGRGSLQSPGGQLAGKYSYGSCFEDGKGTNPEELLAAAEASCFSMALSHALEDAGAVPKKIDTTANVVFEQKGDEYSIGKITLTVRAAVQNIEQAEFLLLAEASKANCPISRSLAGNVRIVLDAKIVPETELRAAPADELDCWAWYR